MIIIRLPRPRSVNGLFSNRPGKYGRTKTPRYRAWREEAMQEIMAQRTAWPDKGIIGPYKLEIVIERGAGDLGNLEKCVSDVLVAMNVVRDDADAEEILLRWASNGEIKGCEVRVECCQGDRI